MSGGHVGRTEIIPKIKVTVTNKRLFRTVPNALSDKTILQNYFLNCFSSKVMREKKSLTVKTFVLLKRLKNKQILISMHHLVIKLPLEPFGSRQFAKKIKSNTQ